MRQSSLQRPIRQDEISESFYRQLTDLDVCTDCNPPVNNGWKGTRAFGYIAGFEDVKRPWNAHVFPAPFWQAVGAGAQLASGSSSDIWGIDGMVNVQWHHPVSPKPVTFYCWLLLIAE